MDDGLMSKIEGDEIAPDRVLAGRIAVLMAYGTNLATALLVGAVIALIFGLGPLATVLLTGGCATLVLLPFIRLLMMFSHFRHRGESRFLIITVLVIAMVLAGAALGLLRR